MHHAEDCPYWGRHSALVASFLSKVAVSGSATRGAKWLDIWYADGISYAVVCFIRGEKGCRIFGEGIVSWVDGGDVSKLCKLDCRLGFKISRKIFCGINYIRIFMQISIALSL